MDRSLAGRIGFGGLLGRPARARPIARAPRGRAARSRQASALDRALALIASALSGLARLLRRFGSLAWRRRRLRALLIAAAIATPLLAGGWLWLRGSSLVAVRHVRVLGAHGSEARSIEAALSAAARRMTTLDVHTDALRAAVAGYPVVRDVRVTTSFPHGIDIRVVEQPAVATLSIAGAKTAVAADGVVLGPGLASGALPALSGAGPVAPPSPGRHLHDASLLGELAVLGAAPQPLAKLVIRAYTTTKGLTVAMRSGLLVYFGDATRPHAKWLSLESVLASSGSVGASYVDVRLPERPAAGFPGGAAPPSSGSEGEAGSEASSAASPDSESSEALATGLSAAVGGGSPSSSQPSSSGSTGGEAESQASGEADSQASGESEAHAEPETEH
jgi:cell division protein FtsQ